ncbi:MAG: T9SS type A sorting domain-containing protein [Saprospiraceae bacterium]|nr:T9SS type A sorting domain-containing protein [Saprospiraceae bacterium]
MKNLLLLFALSLINQCLSAQPCLNSQSSIDIHGNNIQARILNGGDLFTDLANGQFLPNPDPNSFENPSTIFAAGIWLGGIDPGGNLKLATVDYRSNLKFDYTPGPLDENGTTNVFNCSNWDRHFRVTGDQIAAFRAALPLTTSELITQFRDIAGWPALGNPFFADVWGYDLPFSTQGLASFHDEDNNGSYDPLSGDYPVVELRGIPAFVPAEIIWSVFNDQNGGGPHSASGGKALQAEIQLTVWAFNCQDEPVLNNTIFTSHKIINRASEPTDSTTFGIWVDIDLGCYLDDYLGCNPSLNTMYAYNQDAVDGQPGNTCLGVPTFSDAPPVQSITFLSHPLSTFIAPSGSGGNPPPATTDPTSPYEIYNYMTGSWRDGSPLTYGGNGYGGNTPTSHLFPSDPANSSGWSMCTANLAFGDRRMLGTTNLGQLLPGQIEYFNTAWAFHPNPSLPCGIGTTFSDVNTIINLYNNDFEGVCGPLKAPSLPADSLQLFPNPTSGSALLRYGSLRPVSLRAFDAAGRMVLEKTNNFEKQETVIETATFAAGIYVLQIVTEQGTATKKLTVVR